jgi:hypothetical protein
MHTQARLNIPHHGRKLIDWISEKPWQTLFVGVLLALLILPGYRWFSIDFSYMSWFFEDDATVQEFRQFEDYFGNDETIMIAVHSPSGVFDQETATLLGELTDAMWLLPDVMRVDSLANFDWTHSVNEEMVVEPLLPAPAELSDALLFERQQIALAHEILPGYLIGADGNTAMLIARLRPGTVEKPLNTLTVVEAARALMSEYQRGDHRLYLTGQPVWDVENGTVAFDDLGVILPIAGVGTIVLLIYFLGNITGILLSFVVAVVTIVTAMALPGWFGWSHGAITMGSPQMLLALGLADAIHMLSVFYAAKRRGLSQKDAAVFSMEKNYMPTILTTVSTAIGFISCCLSPIRQVVYMGAVAGIGVILAWFFTYLILAPLMVLIPCKIKTQPEQKHQRRQAFSQALARWIVVNRKAIMWLSLLISVFAVAISSQNKINSNPVFFYEEDNRVRADFEFMSENVGGLRPVEFLIKTGKKDGIKELEFLSRLDQFQRELTALPYVSSAVSIVDVLKATNRALYDGDEAAYRLPESQDGVAQELLLYTMSLPQGSSIDDKLSADYDVLRLTVLISLTDTTESTRAIGKMQSRAKELGLDVIVTGKTIMFDGLSHYMVMTFILSFTVAAMLISLLLCLVFKSWKLGLLSLLPNMIPIAVGGAVLYFMQYPLDPPMSIVISLCLGIAVDDTIHILANYRRLMTEGYRAQDAIAEIFEKTAPALVTTTTILVVVFGSFLTASFVPNAHFGIITAVVLAFALVFDLLFLPAMLSFPWVSSIIDESNQAEALHEHLDGVVADEPGSNLPLSKA